MCKDSAWAARVARADRRARDRSLSRNRFYQRARKGLGACGGCAGGAGHRRRTNRRAWAAGPYLRLSGGRGTLYDGDPLAGWGRVGTVDIAAAVATCEAIEACTPYRPGIKWVNDLLLGEKKICGILAEAVTSPSGARGAVVGIGVNLAEGALPEELRGIAGALGGVERDALAGRIYQNLLRDAFEPQ